jgi:hypothetical protein
LLLFALVSRERMKNALVRTTHPRAVAVSALEATTGHRPSSAATRQLPAARASPLSRPPGRGCVAHRRAAYSSPGRVDHGVAVETLRARLLARSSAR